MYEIYKFMQKTIDFQRKNYYNIMKLAMANREYILEKGASI